MKSRTLVTAIVLVAVGAAAIPLSALGTVQLLPSPYVIPRPGLVISGTDKTGRLRVILRVSHSVPYYTERVSGTVICNGKLLHSPVSMGISYTHFSAGQLHGAFGLPSTRKRPFGLSGYFKTPKSASIVVRLRPSAKTRCFGIVVKLGNRFQFRIRRIIHLGGTPSSPPTPPLQSGLALTQCPTNTRSNPLPSNTPFVVKGQLLPAQAGQTVKLVYTTLQRPPGSQSPTQFVSTAADGTFSATFAVPYNTGIRAEAGITATAGGHTASCLFFDQ